MATLNDWAEEIGDYFKSLDSRIFAMESLYPLWGNAGAVLYVNTSNTAIIMEWPCIKDASIRRIFIGKANIRFRGKTMGGYNKDLSLTNFYPSNSTAGGSYINGTSTSIGTKTEVPVLTNSEFRTLWSNLATDGTAKSNCDTWLSETDGYTYSSYTGSPAIEYARSLTIDGHPCDVPNEEELMMMYLNAERIDSLDDTAEFYPDFALGKNVNSNGRFRFNNTSGAQSCTESSEKNLRYVGYTGNCGTLAKTSICTIIPIVELF